MKLCMFLPFEPDARWKIARQAGVTHAVVKLAPELTRLNPPWDFSVVAKAQQRFRDAGFVLEGLEGDQFDMNRIKLGLDGRDGDLVLYEKMVRNLGELGVPLLCYNFMAGIGWFRTRTDIPERGGAVTCGFDLADADSVQNLPKAEPPIPSETIWNNYVYFLERILPVAESSGVRLGLHPDDPPIPSLRGFGRIFYDSSTIRRALNLSQSRSHGLTFCQANFFAAGENVPKLIEEWKDRIVFVHFRDVRGTAASFVETFHDNGPHDMGELVRLYKKIRFDGPIRTDHAPSMEGEGSATGYEILGHLFALGYLKGLIDATD